MVLFCSAGGEREHCGEPEAEGVGGGVHGREQVRGVGSAATRQGAGRGGGDGARYSKL